MESEYIMRPISSTQCANLARRLIVKISFKSNTAHIGSALSVTDVLAVLFKLQAGKAVNNFDEIVLSKGHAALSLYSILCVNGFIEEHDLEKYGLDGNVFSGHVSHLVSPLIPVSTGSLGHGLPFGLGLAMANKMLGLKKIVFVIISDGELNEGTTWESALIANQLKLNNLVVVIDRNGLQSLGPTEKILKLNPIMDKWKSFGWEVLELDGHNHSQIEDAVSSPRNSPLCIVASTIKGKGVKLMENDNLWHYRPPTQEIYSVAIAELENNAI